MPHFCCALVACLIFVMPAIADDKPQAKPEIAPRQSAIQQGRDLLTRGETAKAVEVLEQQLDRVGGDPGYVTLLKDAYKAYLKELQLGNKSETFEVYRKRLAVLELPTSKSSNDPKPKEIARGVAPDDDPFQQTPVSESSRGNDFLVAAEKAFVAEKYGEALINFKQAGRAGASLSQPQQSQYAYCLMHDVVARLNAGNAPSSLLEKDAKAAMALIPANNELNKFGQQVLREIASRPATPGLPTIKHGEANGWKFSESLNFRLFHRQEADYAEQFLSLAEQSRTAAFTKWATPSAMAWSPSCDIYLHSRGDDYAKATNQPATSPGHSTMKCADGKVATRRMDLRADDANLLGSTLPHEVTHVVLGDLFADVDLPHWADEGMAVLSEPRMQIDRYVKTMIRLRSEGKLIPLAQILGQSEYPDAKSITVFYVESVSVVEFMVNLKGPAQFVSFMRDRSRGLDAALQRHYAIRNIADLQDHWLRATFTEIDRASSSSAGR